MSCPQCGESARHKGFRGRGLVSLFGPVKYVRDFYHCRDCQRCSSPLDGAIGLRSHDLTPAADEVVSLSGLQDAFVVGAETLLRRMTGLQLSESTVQRTTEAAGTRVADAQHAGQTFGSPTPWNWHRDAEGKTVGLYCAPRTGRKKWLGELG